MTEHHDPHALLLLIQKGDSSAYEVLYEQIRPMLCGYILKKYGPTLDESDAEDAFHNAMLKVWTCSHQYLGINALGWLYKIAQSEASKIVSVKMRLQSLDEDDECGSFSHEKSPFFRDANWECEDSVEERVIKSSSITDLEKNIEYLSSEDQELIRLRYKEEYTFEDIGRHLKRTKVRAKQKHDGIIAKLLSLFKLN